MAKLDRKPRRNVQYKDLCKKAPIATCLGECLCIIIPRAWIACANQD